MKKACKNKIREEYSKISSDRKQKKKRNGKNEEKLGTFISLLSITLPY